MFDTSFGSNMIGVLGSTPAMNEIISVGRDGHKTHLVCMGINAQNPIIMVSIDIIIADCLH